MEKPGPPRQAQWGGGNRGGTRDQTRRREKAGGEEKKHGCKLGGGRVRGCEMVTSGIPTEQGREKPLQPEAESAQGLKCLTPNTG